MRKLVVVAMVAVMVLVGCDEEAPEAEEPAQAPQAIDEAGSAAGEPEQAGEEPRAREGAERGFQLRGSDGSTVKIGEGGLDIRSNDERVQIGESGIRVDRREMDGSNRNSCSQGRCQQRCPAGETCTHSCSGGHCQQRCERDATCTFTCSGGWCEQICDGGSDCRLTCSGGNCKET